MASAVKSSRPGSTKPGRRGAPKPCNGHRPEAGTLSDEAIPQWQSGKRRRKVFKLPASKQYTLPIWRTIMLIRRPDDIAPSDQHARCVRPPPLSFWRLPRRRLAGSFPCGTGQDCGPATNVLSTPRRRSPGSKHRRRLQQLLRIRLPTRKTPARTAHALRVRPWTLKHLKVGKTTEDTRIEDIPQSWRRWKSASTACAASRGWSMGFPWLGFPVASLLSRVEPLGSAKYVELSPRCSRNHAPA